MALNEQTPLLQTVIVASPRERYTHRTLRRFCTIALTTTLIVITVLFLSPLNVPLLNSKDNDGFAAYLPWSSPFPHLSWPASEGLTYAELQEILLTTPKEEKTREWSQYYTSGLHLAGKNLSQALWTKDLWQEFGIHSSLATYNVYLNYPVDHRLALLEGKKEDSKSQGPRKNPSSELKVIFECRLEEDVLKEDPTSGLENRVPTFHGYSADGNVTARFVYANYGTYWDYEDLVKANVSLEGKIAVVKYGRNYRGLKVKRASELGMIGVVMYSDPQDDGEITVANGYKSYPDGPARNPSSVQRGSVENLNIAPGDPTTPGYPSKPGVPRQDPYHTIPSIPSIPISYLDALPILRSLNGHGPKASDFNEWWQGGGLSYQGVEYNIGPSPSHIVLNLINQQEYVTTPIWDVIGVINGTLSDEVVVLGNHRDAWIVGGAADPNSGSAVLNEVVRSFGVALQNGWKPLRTVVFASWDGEEYGLIGSTEWVEEYLSWLNKTAIAYLNVDIAASGPRFKAEASPLLNEALYAAASHVMSPNQTIQAQTIYDVWDGHIGTLGSGSDYTAFQDFIGIPSISFGFTPSLTSPTYHYHSNYDSFAWMDAYGDPTWGYHLAMAKIWGILAAHLVESPVIGYNTTTYANGLSTYLCSLSKTASRSANPKIRALASFPLLQTSISSLLNITTVFDAYATRLRGSIRENIPWWKWWRKIQLYREVQNVNLRYQTFERKFLHDDGLDGRNLFKHTIFAPGIWTGYSGVTFPGLRESTDKGDLAGVVRWSAIIKSKIDAAADLLKLE